MSRRVDTTAACADPDSDAYRPPRTFGCRRLPSTWQLPERWSDLPEWLYDSMDEFEHDRDGWQQVSEIARDHGIYERRRAPCPKPDPRGHRSESAFENELDDMTAAAVPLLRAFFDADAIYEEFPYAGTFRTDLVVVEVDVDALRTRLDLSDGQPLTEAWKYVKGYRWLQRNGPARPSDYHERGPHVEQTNRGVLNYLRERGLVTATDAGFLATVPVPDMITAHAVELKQRDWETALHQAARASDPGRFGDHWRSNRNPETYGYADYRWVVMDAGSVGAEEAIAHADWFRGVGVGLFTLDQGGLVRHVDAAACDPPRDSVDRIHANERALERIDVDAYRERIHAIERREEREAVAGGGQTGLSAFDLGSETA